jgi:hypothetical protein
MGEGPEILTATATDPAGNVGAAATADIAIDTVAPIAVNDQNSTDLTVAPTVTTLNGGPSGDVGSLISLGLIGDTVSVNLLTASTAFTVDVATGTTQQITVSGGGDELLGVNLGTDKDLDLLIYRQVDGSNQASLVQVQTNWLDYSPGIAGALLGSWEGAPLQLNTFSGGATYYVVVGNAGTLLDLGALTRINVETDSSILTDSNNLIVDATPIIGNVTSNDDGVGQAITVTSVNGDPVSGETTIVGDYGTLVIDSNGSYTYTPTKNVSGIGQTDEFEYTIDDGNGNTDNATLSIDITSDYTPPVPFSARMMLENSFTLADDADAIDLPQMSLLVSDEGFDILSFEGADQAISLADIMQPDIIDISGIGANILNIAAEDINSAIYVQGDSDDTVNLEGDGWSNVEQTTLGTDIYNAWQLGEDVSTQIYIDTNITNVI